MQWLINWIRSWFCQHDIKVIDGFKARHVTCGLGDGWIYHKHPTKIFYCTKCAYNKQRWG